MKIKSLLALALFSSCTLLSLVDAKEVKIEPLKYSVTLKEGEFTTNKGLALDLRLEAPEGTIVKLEDSEDQQLAYSTDLKTFKKSGSSDGIKAFFARHPDDKGNLLEFTVEFSKIDPNRSLWIKDTIDIMLSGGTRASKMEKLDMSKGGTLTIEKATFTYKKAQSGAGGIEITFKETPKDLSGMEFYDAAGKLLKPNSTSRMNDNYFSFDFGGKQPASMKLVFHKELKKIALPVDIKINLGLKQA